MQVFTNFWILSDDEVTVWYDCGVTCECCDATVEDCEDMVEDDKLDLIER